MAWRWQPWQSQGRSEWRYGTSYEGSDGTTNEGTDGRSYEGSDGTTMKQLMEDLKEKKILIKATKETYKWHIEGESVVKVAHLETSLKRKRSYERSWDQHTSLAQGWRTNVEEYTRVERGW